MSDTKSTMKLLLIITALVEAATGLALIFVPSVATSLLLGVPLQTSAGLVVGLTDHTLSRSCVKPKDREGLNTALWLELSELNSKQSGCKREALMRAPSRLMFPRHHRSLLDSCQRLRDARATFHFERLNRADRGFRECFHSYRWHCSLCRWKLFAVWSNCSFERAEALRPQPWRTPLHCQDLVGGVA